MNKFGKCREVFEIMGLRFSILKTNVMAGRGITLDALSKSNVLSM